MATWNKKQLEGLLRFTLKNHLRTNLSKSSNCFLFKVAMYHENLVTCPMRAKAHWANIAPYLVSHLVVHQLCMRVEYVGQGPSHVGRACHWDPPS